MDDNEPTTSLKQLREQMGVTQEEVARRMKMSQPGVARLENVTDWNPKIGTIREYIECLGGELEIYVEISNRKSKLAI